MIYNDELHRNLRTLQMKTKLVFNSLRNRGRELSRWSLATWPATTSVITRLFSGTFPPVHLPCRAGVGSTHSFGDHNTPSTPLHLTRLISRPVNARGRGIRWREMDKPWRLLVASFKRARALSVFPFTRLSAPQPGRRRRRGGLADNWPLQPQRKEQWQRRRKSTGPVAEFRTGVKT